MGFGAAAPRLWNHNIHYFSFIEKIARKKPRSSAIDVGTGDGMLAARLHAFIPTVVGLDASQHQVDVATERYGGPAGLSFEFGDVTDLPGRHESYDLVACSAAIHHMDLRAALERFRDLTNPGGTLVIIGLGRKSTPVERLLSLISLVASRLMRARLGWYDHGAPMEEPHQAYVEIEKVALALLPGARFRRLLYWRYSLVWDKPAS